jgi:cell division protein ZapE
LATVAARLAQEVAAQRLQADTQQHAAAARLDALAAQLAQRTAGFSGRARRRLGALGRLLPQQSAGAPRGVYLWGGVGRGKTLLMDFFYDSLDTAARERTHFYRFMRDVHAGMRASPDREDPLAAVAAAFARRARILCLDEFFVADIGDAMLLSGMLHHLFARGVTLVATSNVPPHDLYREGLQRSRFLPAIAAIEAHVDVINLDAGIDYRLRQLQQAPTYLDAADPATEPRLERRFARLAGAPRGAPLTIDVEGRPIRALASAPDMVWFEFSDICDGPRSQNDYIEIARLYHTVFIANIPVFTVANENAARRFIMLIDEFYDRNVNVVLSAAAPPTDLYRGEGLRFEFERAASRLIEMQTQEYLGGQHRA